MEKSQTEESYVENRSERGNDDDDDNGREDGDKGGCGYHSSPSNPAGQEKEQCLEDTRDDHLMTSTTSTTRKDQIKLFLRAHFRSLMDINYAQIAFVPGLRTGCILILEWSLLGIGNSNSTAFQLGCLYVGLSDPCNNLSQRLRCMGLTLLTVMFFGTLLPGLVWDRHAVWDILTAFFVAFLTGLSPLLESPPFFLSMKLGTALFAINGAINRNTNGYGGLANSLAWTMAGSSASLLAALVPEIIGNRDARRSDLGKVYHGVGAYLSKYGSQFGTARHFQLCLMPNVTLSIWQTQDNVYRDKTEDVYARRWLLNLMDKADAIRTASICLANVYQMIVNHQEQQQQQLFNNNNNANILCKAEKEMDDLFLAVGRSCRGVAVAFQFPWIARYIVGPCVLSSRGTRRHRRDDDAKESNDNNSDNRNSPAPRVKEAASALKTKLENMEQDNLYFSSAASAWLPPLVELLEKTVQETVELVLQIKPPNKDVDIRAGIDVDKDQQKEEEAWEWPKYSSIRTLPKRLRAAFPSSLSEVCHLKDDPNWAARVFALRFALAFTLASLPEMLNRDLNSAHWFPMTVALIMGPSCAATLDKVSHRTIGTLLGVGLGAALYSLFRYPAALILLLGLNTYAVCILFPASYVGFTFFITGWVFTTTVGTGSPLGETIFSRCIWTLAAAALVVLVMYVRQPKMEAGVVAEKLATKAKAVKSYAKAVKDVHLLLRSDEEQENGMASSESPCTERVELLEAAREKVNRTRGRAIQARLSLMTCMNEAVLTPSVSSSLLIDPHEVAPAVASDLMDAVVFPQYVSVVEGDKVVDDIVSTFDDEAFSELERLAARLEQRLSSNVNDNPTQNQAQKEHNAFSKAIACAHMRLDKTGVPG